ncbi:LLM class F420-dependent oxidoreductase [Thermopolyspora flexuosa]|uniref:F420-dependent oxidoreductase-like protein n=1 Tax=Thermopolyspora flexuosa TaxID=103836 RepID=A0A543J115_9ACTN|nr:TIGR03564 family F420-dependent LLM class oxidoreductase [Thermopolyspora flexuosa]TQM76508.1 F420-dependent oxidoreductase-like protein [Thermopolyspora flexuosa]GGM84793.1 LLM class F420-dependent oxidoreductase [Thermopolyspora flexuosa]
MRIGLYVTAPSGPDAIDRLHTEIVQAERDGFATVWLSHIFGLDALTALAVAGRGVPRIEFCTAVVPIYPRHPAALAQQALTANAALGGRLTLGIGVSHKVTTEDMYGYRFDRPARHMDEYLSVLLPLMRGERADFDGETVTAHIALEAPGTGASVLLAAMAPRMLRMAGERADGTVLWMTGPRTVAEHIVPTITAAAEAAGRPAPRVVCGLPICVTDDPETVRARADRVFAGYGELPSYRAMLDREGARGPGDVAIVGDEKAVSAALENLAAAGVTDFAASVFARGEEAARTRALLKSLL